MISQTIPVLRAWTPFVAQLLLGLTGLLAFAIAPPARGAMLLVPLTGSAERSLSALAVAHGALLLGHGPLAGSMLVRGERALLTGALLRRGIVTIGAPSIICGKVPGSVAA